jgi:myosin-6
MDDVKDFAVMEKPMSDCGLDAAEKSNVFRISAAVLHIGNLTFEESADGNASVSASSQPILNCVSAMLGLDPNATRDALCFSIAGSESKKALTGKVALYGKNALAKALHSKLFDWCVFRINKCFPFDKSENYIGVLDIAGFEYFQHNSFGQFCINYCNEKLQQFFNIRVLKDEQELYVDQVRWGRVCRQPGLHRPHRGRPRRHPCHAR